MRLPIVSHTLWYARNAKQYARSISILLPFVMLISPCCGSRNTRRGGANDVKSLIKSS